MRRRKRLIFTFWLLILLSLLIARLVRAQDCAITVDASGWHDDFSLLVNGYCYDGYAIPGLVSRTTYNAVQPTHSSTRALYQAEGVIDETARLNGMTMDGVEGYVSLMSPSMAGWKLFIRRDAQSEWIAVRNVDSVKREHMYFHLVNEESGIELSYELADRLGVITQVNADKSRYLYGLEMCLTESDPQSVCSDTAQDLTTWFLDTLVWARAS